MVYCIKCGTQNDDSAQACKNCGQPLSHLPRQTRWARKPRRHDDDMCFGHRDDEDMCFGHRGWGGAIVGVIIGMIILLWGVSMLLEQYYGVKVEFWPFIVIVIGMIILIAVLKRPRPK